MPPSIPDILAKIVAARRSWVEAAIREGSESDYPGELGDRTVFPEALRAAEGSAIIAEVKMGSPRLGSLEGRLDPEDLALTYARHGAAALSVVVEPDFFFGSYDLLRRCRMACGLPTIAKDFVVDPVQLTWARNAGADAVLLIAALYDVQTLSSLAVQAHGLGLAVLIETHDARDLEVMPSSGVELVGVNNRDLRTFDVSLDRSIEMVAKLPPEAVRVAESGIDDRRSIERLELAGFEAFLIGESLLLAADVAAKLHELKGDLAD